MSTIKDSKKDQIANRRAKIVSLRAQMTRKKEEKSKRMASLASSIKSTSSPSSKENYRKTKLTEAARFEREIDSIKRQIEQEQKYLEIDRKSLAAMK